MTSKFQLFFIAWLCGSIPYSSAQINYKVNWTKDPFDRKLFVENLGQFDNDINTNERVFYQAVLGNAKAYFTSRGVIYRYEKYRKEKSKVIKDQIRKKEEEEEEREHARPQIDYLSAMWQGGNSTSIVEGMDQQSYYYTYPEVSGKNRQANIFKKIVYRDIYPGIDVEYSFPEGKKTGLKYALIIHPGADITQVKLKYKGASSVRLDPDGNIVVRSAVGELTDHAPSSSFEGGAALQSAFRLKENNVSFFLKTSGIPNWEDQTIIIDPWISDPNFYSPDRAYDIDYDRNGNVYAYGGYSPFQLTKFNSSGIQQWTFNATSINNMYYGDFAVDKLTGTSYLAEGTSVIAGAQVLKVNTLGFLSASFPGNIRMQEIWRIVYNSCTGQIVIGGGGVNGPLMNNSNYQASMLDTNFTMITPVNALADTNGGHDACLMALDPKINSVYMAISETHSGITSFNNVLMALPVPALRSPSYIVSDGYRFGERTSINYVYPGSFGPYLSPANGMNGMAAGTEGLYLYDGATLQKRNKSTGALSLSLFLNPPVISLISTDTAIQVNWGGLDADPCDNVYIGNTSSLQIYNSSIVISSLPHIIFNST